jgi:hypothetical protein
LRNSGIELEGVKRLDGARDPQKQKTYYQVPITLIGGRKMITKEQLARFILQVSEGSYPSEDWQRIAVNHYSDEKMEDARRKLVRYVLGYPPPKEEEHLSLKERLVAIAATLKP